MAFLKTPKAPRSPHFLTVVSRQKLYFHVIKVVEKLPIHTSPARMFLEAARRHPFPDVAEMVRASSEEDDDPYIGILMRDAVHEILDIDIFLERLLHFRGITFWHATCRLLQAGGGAAKIRPTSILLHARAMEQLLEAFPMDESDPITKTRLSSEPLKVHIALEEFVRGSALARRLVEKHSKGPHAPKHLSRSWEQLVKRL